ncbi:hypothetical protein W97_05415 [Coniosporium apollinis CBS 100218]|uniref:Uncharacterized protein n=1 Tax=Coniosporium apollinis (strain CBS 100218) TaxID=1168221 RepID=R7YWZ6_CONA1|nr:uncharacterized protein W97_05415 [Coniosporium apollinis CBS 100218]EON66171.1 hypothetical protein W97_05415 [Coniosporium apollinis CBS 100218]
MGGCTIRELVRANKRVTPRHVRYFFHCREPLQGDGGAHPQVERGQRATRAVDDEGRKRVATYASWILTGIIIFVAVVVLISNRKVERWDCGAPGGIFCWGVVAAAPGLCLLSLLWSPTRVTAKNGIAGLLAAYSAG